MILPVKKFSKNTWDSLKGVWQKKIGGSGKTSKICWKPSTNFDLSFRPNWINSRVGYLERNPFHTLNCCTNWSFHQRTFCPNAIRVIGEFFHYWLPLLQIVYPDRHFILVIAGGPITEMVICGLRTGNTPDRIEVLVCF